MIHDPMTLAHVQLYKAVVLLASGDGVIQERLTHAYLQFLRYIDVTSLKKETQEKLSPILQELKALEHQKRLLSLEPNTAVEFAMRLLLIYDETTR